MITDSGFPCYREKQDVMEAQCKASHFVKGSKGNLHKWVISKLNPTGREGDVQKQGTQWVRSWVRGQELMIRLESSARMPVSTLRFFPWGQWGPILQGLRQEVIRSRGASLEAEASGRWWQSDRRITMGHRKWLDWEDFEELKLNQELFGCQTPLSFLFGSTCGNRSNSKDPLGE